MEEAGVRRCVCMTRGTELTWTANNGAPDTIVSAWVGHTDLSFTKRTCVYAGPQCLRARKAFGPAGAVYRTAAMAAS